MAGCHGATTSRVVDIGIAGGVGEHLVGHGQIGEVLHFGAPLAAGFGGDQVAHSLELPKTEKPVARF